MSTGRIYWYDDDSNPQYVDFSQRVQDLEDVPVVEVTDTFAVSGRRYRQVGRAYRRVTVLIERFGAFGSSSLERALNSLGASMAGGAAFAVSLDHARTWCGRAVVLPSVGDTTLYTGGNGFIAMSGSAALASGDEVRIEGGGPGWRDELTTISTPPTSAGVVVVADKVRYHYTSNMFSGEPILRWRDFWPVCYRPEGEVRSVPLVGWDKRRNYTMKLVFEYCPADVLALFDSLAEGAASLNLPDTGDSLAGKVSGDRIDMGGGNVLGWRANIDTSTLFATLRRARGL